MSSTSLKILSCKNAYVRYAINTIRFSHITLDKHSLGWLSCRNKRLFLSTAFLHRILFTKKPYYIADNLMFKDRHYSNRRHFSEKVIPPSANLYFNSFIITTGKFWNSPRQPKITEEEGDFVLKLSKTFAGDLKINLLNKEQQESIHTCLISKDKKRN